ncbi:MAG: tetratricopeptide repeat protein [Candidatus Promineifilaceae bacterium]
MRHDPTFVAIIERNLKYFTDEIAKANGNARQFLQSERENIFDAVKYAARIPQANYAAAKLLVAISHLIEQNDSPSQWTQVFVRIVNRYASDDSFPICGLYNRLGRFSRQIGEYQRSLRIYEKSLTIASSHNNVFEMANAEYGRSMNYLWLTELKLAKERVTIANQLLDTVDNDNTYKHRTRGLIYSVLGHVALNEKRFAESEAAFDIALQSLQGSEYQHDAGLVLLNRARLFVAQEQFEKAITLTEEIIHQFELSDDWLSCCDAKIMLGNIYIWQQEWQDALIAYDHVSVHELRKRGHHKHCARLHNNIGNALYYLGRYEAAKSHFNEAISIYREYEASSELAASLAMFASTQALLGFRKRAQENIAEAENLLQQFKPTLFIDDVYADLEQAKKNLYQRKTKFHNARKTRKKRS